MFAKYRGQARSRDTLESARSRSGILLRNAITGSLKSRSSRKNLRASCLSLITSISILGAEIRRYNSRPPAAVTVRSIVPSKDPCLDPV